MKVLLFRKNPRLPLSMGKGARGIVVDAHPAADLAAMAPDLPDGTIVYLDLAGLGRTQREKALAMIGEHRHLLFGVIDPGGVVPDIAALFHDGAVDYLGKTMRTARLDAKRIARVRAWAHAAVPKEAPAAEGAASAEQSASPAEGAAGDGWSRVVSGKEQEFGILFVEVDAAEELKRRHEPENLAGAMERFRSFVDRIGSQHGGRTWMWSQFGGLVLFPLSSGACAAPVCGLRLLLARVVYDVEESLLPGSLSFRLALSKGSMVYRERDTGEIISDSLNSVFHLGRRFTRPGQFFLTEDTMRMVPDRLKALCAPVGPYEGRKIFRLIPPQVSVPARPGGRA